jgi:hypothetical protein
LGRFRLTRGFLRAVQRLDREDRKATAATLRALERDWPGLPAKGDRAALIPPVLRCHARAVASTDLWVYFDVRGEEIRVLAVAPALIEDA